MHTTPENLKVDGNKTKSQGKDQVVRKQYFKEGLRGQDFFSLRKEKVNEDQDSFSGMSQVALEVL